MTTTTTTRGSPILGAVVLAAGAAYALTAARQILGGDNGEFATLAATGGVAHPPGYPLYVGYLRALSWLPASSPAHNASLSTAILGVVSVALVQRASMAWGASAFAAALVSSVYAFAPLTWQLATHAEAFTLNAVLALVIVTLSAPRCSIEPTLRVALLGLTAGLGLSNHHSIVLLAPLGLFAAVSAVRAAPRRALAVAYGVAGIVLGLTPYAYLVHAARHARDATWVWGDTSDFRGLCHHFLRVDYGTTELGISSHERAPLAHLAALGTRLFTDYLALPGIAALGCGVWLYAQRRAKAPIAVSGAKLAMVASFVLAGPLFVSWFNLPPRHIGALIAERFYLLPAALLAVLAAPAFDQLMPTIATRPRMALPLVALSGVVAALLAFPSVREHHRPTVELYVRNALAIAPSNAIILGTGDHRFGAFLYARYALGLRPDVVFINPRLLLGDWYPPRISRQLGLEVERGKGKDRVLDAAALTVQMLGTRRAIFFTDWFATGLDRSLPSYPLGPLIRIVPRASDVPEPHALLALNLDVDAQLELEPSPPSSPRTWAGDIAADYARPWRVLANAFRSQDDPERASMCERRARELVPWLAAP